MKLALFDFDGTITTHDTLMEFTKYSVGNVRFLTGLAVISPVLVLQKLKVVSAQKAKEIFLSHFFIGMSLNDFELRCKTFTDHKLQSLIRPGALDAIRKYKAENTRVIIVSASPYHWLLPWATALGIEVLSTRLEFIEGKLTGKISGKNCNGAEKVNRIQEHLSLKEYSDIIVYGDTSGDKEMLALGTETHYKPFR